MTPILSGSMYLGFIGAFCLVTGIICIIPLLIIILGKVGIINSKNLRKSRKYVILIMLAIELSFIPTTDVITVAVVILPITLLYELAIWIVYFIERRIKKRNKLI
jgi:sec-independent protein translocase protein TatC